MQRWARTGDHFVLVRISQRPNASGKAIVHPKLRGALANARSTILAFLNGPDKTLRQASAFARARPSSSVRRFTTLPFATPFPRLEKRGTSAVSSALRMTSALQQSRGARVNVQLDLKMQSHSVADALRDDDCCSPEQQWRAWDERSVASEQKKDRETEGLAKRDEARFRFASGKENEDFGLPCTPARDPLAAPSTPALHIATGALTPASTTSDANSGHLHASAASKVIDDDGLGLGEAQPAPGFHFVLDPDVVSRFAQQRPPFGFNGLGEVVFRRTYARLKADGTREEWFETVERVVNGVFSMMREWADRCGSPWDEASAQLEAAEMYQRIFTMKFLPPGRGLWAMGSSLTTERRLYAALNNCAFVSTAGLASNPTKPFEFLMDLSMLGVGVGFDTKGAGTVTVHAPAVLMRGYPENGAGSEFSGAEAASDAIHVIQDSREGWVNSLKVHLEAYFLPGKPLPVFDYSIVRPAGSPIKGFGGVSQGPAPLRELHEAVDETLRPMAGQKVTVTAIVDIMNKIGRCVIAGNVRRTAEIVLGDPDSDEYLDLKDYSKNPERAAFGWTSNNSILARLGMDYSKACDRVRLNGEPGFAWLDNMQNYGRMNGELDERDKNAAGGNPCLEQTLHSHELCCLVETFPERHENLAEYKETLKWAFLYAKAVTLGATHWTASNEVMLKNRRIGCSMSGLAQFVSKRGTEELREWCEAGYQTVNEVDELVSRRFNIPKSIKVTSVKPSGTVSLLAGATPGMHYPEARLYIRRVRLAKNSELIGPLRAAGYPVEPCVSDPKGTVVAEFPVDAGEGVRTAKEVTMWEQLSFAAFLQRHWSDNQVSCTVTFDPESEGPQLSHALNYFQYQLKGVSFLPRLDYGAYPQMPYEAIDAEEYARRVAALKMVDFSAAVTRAIGDVKAPAAASVTAFQGAVAVGVDEAAARTATVPVGEALAAEEMPDKFCDTDTCML